MSVPMQSQNRLEIRQSIGSILGVVKTGTASSTGDSESLIDTYGLRRGGSDNYIGRQVMINSPAGSIVSGEKSGVIAFDNTNKDATLAPAFTASTSGGDTYEMWELFEIEEVNSAINDAIKAVTRRALLEKKTENTWTIANVYEYAWLTGFVGLHRVEYVSSIGIEVVVDRCEVAWTAGSNVVATADTSFKQEGSASVKLVVAAGASAGAILGYEDISSIDISDCDKVEFWLYSSIALTAGQLQIHIGSTAAIASAEETIDIPAMDAATLYRHSLTLANPLSDTAIISVGFYQVSDVGAFTLYADDIRAVKAGSRRYESLNPQYWSVVKDGTNSLKFTTAGKSVVGTNTLIRLLGYAIPALLSDDTTDSEVDPDYLIARVTGKLALSHAKSPRLQIQDRIKFAQDWLRDAELLKSQISTTIMPNSVFF